MNKANFIKGSIVAIVTPMYKDGTLDLNSLRSLIDWHIESGTNAIVVLGTSGESPTISIDEYLTLIKATVDHVCGEIPVIAGASSNSTSYAIKLTEYAKSAGADATLQVVPYYNKPTQEGIYQHFRTISERVELPLILYNVPSRTSSDISNETILRLAQIPSIIGIKDATSNIERTLDLIKRAPGNFSIFSGDDLTAIAVMLLGGNGVISVTANLVPTQMRALCEAAMSHDVPEARRIHFQLMTLHKALFAETNPIPVKWALHRIGRIDSGIRLPLTPLTPEGEKVLISALSDINITL